MEGGETLLFACLPQGGSGFAGVGVSSGGEDGDARDTERAGAPRVLFRRRRGADGSGYGDGVWTWRGGTGVDLVYVLDAWEDRARDAKTGDFNALLAFPQVDGRAEILATVASLEKDLPPHLAARLRTNVEERLGMRVRIIHGACKKSARERWRSAVEFARSMKKRERAGFLKGSAVLATVSLLAFFAPHPIRSAESWKQCFGLVMNLMAFGAVFATVPVPEGPEKKSGFWSWYCSCCGDSCDCGDCCCECGGCCDCL